MVFIQHFIKQFFKLLQNKSRLFLNSKVNLYLFVQTFQDIIIFWERKVCKWCFLKKFKLFAYSKKQWQRKYVWVHMLKVNEGLFWRERVTTAHNQCMVGPSRLWILSLCCHSADSSSVSQVRQWDQYQKQDSPAIADVCLRHTVCRFWEGTKKLNPVEQVSTFPHTDIQLRLGFIVQHPISKVPINKYWNHQKPPRDYI